MTALRVEALSEELLWSARTSVDALLVDDNPLPATARPKTKDLLSILVPFYYLDYGGTFRLHSQIVCG